MILISDADGTLTFESNAVEQILGPRLTPRPVISIYDNMHPDDLPLARELFEKLVGDPTIGQARDIEIRKRHNDGSWRWLHVTASNLLNDPAVHGVVMNARDVTERRIAEQALRESEQQLRASEERFRA
jgi:PAS domain S-box-containing protein